ncbi:MAG: hypothetical protein WCL16_13730 [bacterium]
MKALEWMRFLEAQHRQYGKSLFRVAELANVAGRDTHALNIELARLVKKGVIARYTTGVYGLPDRADVEQLVPILDDGAYLTGAYALYRHNLVTQPQSEMACFTNRRHNRSRERATPFGRLVFVRIASKVYRKPTAGVLASPEQAFIDFIHLAQKRGVDPSSIVTFQRLARLSQRRLSLILKRYPPSVGKRVHQILSSA